MARSDSKGLKRMPSFPELKGHERQAVILREKGRTYEQITNHINDEYAMEYRIQSVAEWFHYNGRLYAAYQEYTDKMARISYERAKRKLLKHQEDAVDELYNVMKNGETDRDRRMAAATILAKYIPDKQVVFDKTDGLESDLPPALDEEAKSVYEQISNDAGDGAQNGGPDGSEAGEASVEGILPEHMDADDTSRAPA